MQGFRVDVRRGLCQEVLPSLVALGGCCFCDSCAGGVRGT